MSEIAEAWERTKRTVMEAYRAHAAPDIGPGLHSLTFTRGKTNGEDTVGVSVFVRGSDGASQEHAFSYVVPTDEKLYVIALGMMADVFRESVEKLMAPVTKTN